MSLNLPRPLYIQKKQPLTFTYQKGVSMAFLLFAIIIISLLAAGLMRLNSQSSVSNVQQVISARAFFAAESGANLQALRIFPVAGGAPNCSNPPPFNFAANGLSGCTATTTCNATLINGVNYFTVTSIGQCNVGQPLQATRRIQVRLR